MQSPTSAFNNDANMTKLDDSLATPSALVNRLLKCCHAFQQRAIAWQLISQALEDCLRNATNAREAFWHQVNTNGLRELIPAPVNMVLEAFQDYGQSLLYTRNSIQDPQGYPLDSAIMLIHDSYMALYDAMLAYEWAYLGQGEEPHPALNLLQKSISAVQQHLMPDARFNELLDRLWNYFVEEQNQATQQISDRSALKRRNDAIEQVLSGIQIMDTYFEAYDINYLHTGYARCHQGCLLIIEQIQETTGEALADAPTPSPQVNWVIHTAKAVIDGLNPELLIKAQDWFEPQLNESFFRFEQYASMATENIGTSKRVLEQIPIARDGFDHFNRALPLLRLGLDRRHLLVKAIRHLEDGARLIFQAWEKLDQLEREGESVDCIRCGFSNPTYVRVCGRCGAKIIQMVRDELKVELPQPARVAPDATPSNAQPIPAHIARLMQAIDKTRTGRIGVNEFRNEVAWGTKLLNTARQSTARLPRTSPDYTINNALNSLREGLRNFNEAIQEMEMYLTDFHPMHLDTASTLLYQACQVFTALQVIVKKR